MVSEASRIQPHRDRPVRRSRSAGDRSDIHDRFQRLSPGFRGGRQKVSRPPARLHRRPRELSRSLGMARARPPPLGKSLQPRAIGSRSRQTRPGRALTRRSNRLSNIDHASMDHSTRRRSPRWVVALEAVQRLGWNEGKRMAWRDLCRVGLLAREAIRRFPLLYRARSRRRGRLARGNTAMGRTRELPRASVPILRKHRPGRGSGALGARWRVGRRADVGILTSRNLWRRFPVERRRLRSP